MLIRGFLDIVKPVIPPIFGKVFILLDVIVRIPADITDGNLSFLGTLLCLTDKILATFLTRCREL